MGKKLWKNILHLNGPSFLFVSFFFFLHSNPVFPFFPPSLCPSLLFSYLPCLISSFLMPFLVCHYLFFLVSDSFSFLFLPSFLFCLPVISFVFLPFSPFSLISIFLSSLLSYHLPFSCLCVPPFFPPTPSFPFFFFSQFFFPCAQLFP
ncbi:hypothetical protein AMECASPLE_026137 [Ameca splendens]|uniref:Uncharacterized protein n=1 Tax=Ameca splendens TaxID=208324 RepID=A0ABV0XTZ3_9TELE